MKKILCLLVTCLAASLFAQSTVKISQLPSSTNMSGAEIVPLVQNGTTVGASVATLHANALNYANVASCWAWENFTSTNASSYPANCTNAFFAIQFTNLTAVAVTAVRPVFGNVTKNATNTITIIASLEYPRGNTNYARIYFNGATNVTLATNQLVTSDPVPVTIAPGAAFDVRVYVTCPNHCAFPCEHLLQGFGGYYDRAQLGTASGDFTMTNAALLQPGIYGFAPLAVLAAPVGSASASAPLSVSLVGDSRIAGPSYLWNILAAQSIPTIQMADIGNKFETETNGYPWDAPASLQASSVILCEMGINSITQDTWPQLTNALYGWAAPFFHAGKRIVLCTCLPYTSSSDSWATLTNQTPVSSNPLRVQWNNWVRSVPQGFAGYLELADVLESGRDSGLWRVDLPAGAITADGLHPNTAGYACLATNLNLGVLFGGPQMAEIPTNIFQTPFYSVTGNRRPPVVSLEASNVVLNFDDYGLTGYPLLVNFHSGGSQMHIVNGGLEVDNSVNCFESVIVSGGIQDEGNASSMTLQARYCNLINLVTHSSASAIDLQDNNGLILCYSNLTAYAGITNKSGYTYNNVATYPHVNGTNVFWSTVP